IPQHRKLGPPDTLPLHPQTAGRNPDFMLIARSKSKSRYSLHGGVMFGAGNAKFEIKRRRPLGRAAGRKCSHLCHIFTVR
ncbi:hypothetical protein, partial [Candidatus Mycobacterium methanotrophicum]|uniref:hypothetical protein n=1 Tax=Candidatus Mycobacterium methanotrophicum TaxID=2943498 RepID=UPI001C569426